MQKNRLNRKRLKIISPMILSMVLLITFVGYWLQNQYYNEKKNLQFELSQLYYQSFQDAEFILYYKKVIKPALAFTDTSSFDHLKIGIDKTSSELKKAYISELKAFVDSSKTCQDLFRAIEVNTIIPDSLKEKRQFEILRLGYKYQIYPGQILYDSIQNPQDTSAQFLRKLFLKTLSNKYPSIKAPKEENIDGQNFESIKKINIKILKRNKLGITIRTNRYNETSILYFDNYFFYLISVILPQIIFGIVLISLSVFALVFAYRSYLTQARLNMLRSDFVSNITHELKIPVATAKAAMEAILSFGITDDMEKTKSYLNMVALEMSRLDSLTTRVLEHSRLESHQHPLCKEETNMNSFVECIVESVKLFYPDSLNIRYQNSTENISISIDQVYIEGVIRNLIENSKKYGGNDVSISVNLWKKGSHVYVSVIDNGPGIPKEYLTKVFDRFFRVPTGDQHNVKGFGLGLSFAALVMKQHNGSVTANNLPDKGCEIALEFPA